MEIQYTPGFKKHFRKLPPHIIQKVAIIEMIFANNPASPKIKTHALKGTMKGLFSFSVDYHYRIIFSYESDGSVTFLDIGTHSIYK